MLCIDTIGVLHHAGHQYSKHLHAHTLLHRQRQKTSIIDDIKFNLTNCVRLIHRMFERHLSYWRATNEIIFYGNLSSRKHHFLSSSISFSFFQFEIVHKHFEQINLFGN